MVEKGHPEQICPGLNRISWSVCLVLNERNMLVSKTSGADFAHRFGGQPGPGVTFHLRACRHDD